MSEDDAVNNLIDIQNALAISGNKSLTNEDIIKEFDKVFKNISQKRLYRIWLKSLCLEVNSSLFKNKQYIDDIDLKPGDYFEIIKMRDNSINTKSIGVLTTAKYHLILLIIRKRRGKLLWTTVGFGPDGWCSPDRFFLEKCQRLLKEEYFVDNSDISKNNKNKLLKTFIENKYKNRKKKSETYSKLYMEEQQKKYKLRIMPTNKQWLVKNINKFKGYNNNSKISVIGASFFNNNQIHRLINLIKNQTNNIKAKLENNIKLNKHFDYLIYENPKAISYSLNVEPKSLLDMILLQRKQNINGIKKFELAQFKNIEYSEYSANCTSSLIRIFPNIIKCDFFITTPALTEPVLKNINKKQMFLSNLVSKRLNNKRLKNKDNFKLNNDEKINENNENNEYKLLNVLDRIIYLFKKFNKLKYAKVKISSNNKNKIFNLFKYINKFKKEYLENSNYLLTKNLWNSKKDFNEGKSNILENIKYNLSQQYNFLYSLIHQLNLKNIPDISNLLETNIINRKDFITVREINNKINNKIKNNITNKNILKIIFLLIINLKKAIILINILLKNIHTQIDYINNTLIKTENEHNVKQPSLKLINNNNDLLKNIIYNEVNKTQNKVNKTQKIVNKNKLQIRLLEYLIDIQVSLKEKSKTAKFLNFSYNSLSDQMKRVISKLKKGNIDKESIRKSKLVELLNKINKRTRSSERKHIDNKITSYIKKIKDNVKKVESMLYKYQLI